MTNDKVIDVLNALIETSLDGARGFQSCAEEVKGSADWEVIRKNRQRRWHGASDVVDIEAALSGNDPLVVLAEIEAAEEFAEKRYREALEKDLPNQIRAIVEGQYMGLQEKLDIVRELKTRYLSSSG